MKYSNIKKGVFISRPNRFIANVLLDGKETVCHVKNTGRCRELLVPGAEVFLWESDNPNRKTKYDLVAVYKQGRLINMDSQIPNAVFGQWVKNSGFFKNLSLVKAEQTYKDSRFDFYIETENEKMFAEVKGVTLEENNIAMFPDAPTERGIKHINHLCQWVEEGHRGCIFFIVQMEGTEYFTPNKKTHPQFADALKTAEEKGVEIYALECEVTPDSITARKFIPVKL